MSDSFAYKSPEAATVPAEVHFAITPSNSVNFTIRPRAIYCQADGTAQIVDAAGTVLPYAMTAGNFIPFRGVRINATGTTGTFYGWY
jgi:hypothetical protein